MNSKRSYLESLNAGRQRKAYASLDELDRSLERMGQKLDRHRPTASSGSPASFSAEQSFRRLARELDRQRGHEEGVASLARIASELKELREDLRHQMSAELSQEFDALRAEIARAYHYRPEAGEEAMLAAEIDRLTGAVEALAGRGDDRNVNLLRLELQELREALGRMAREDTVRSLGERWDNFDRRWNSFEERYTAADTERDAFLAGLEARLDNIQAALHRLPESLPLRSLDEKMRLLAGAVDHFARQDRHEPHALAQIDERLDEISRAIVASAASAHGNGFDTAAFERVEARITSLARQIEELTGDRDDDEVIARLSQLSERVDALAARSDVPGRAVERLARQVSALAERLDQPASTDVPAGIWSGIEQRFDLLAEMLDRRHGDAAEHSRAMLRDLEQRLDDLAARLDGRHATETGGIMEAIDRRFEDLARRLESRPAAGPADSIRQIEDRLDDISHRLEHSGSQPGVDPTLLRSLEAQVAELSAHLTNPGVALPQFEDLAPRLGEIERAVAESRADVLLAARQAAEEAVRSFVGSRPEAAALGGLADDLKALEELARRSDERNAKTFEAVHDTLLKIVDRLSRLETGNEAEFDKPSEDANQPAAMRHAFGGAAQSGYLDRSSRASPAEAAAAAALAALAGEDSDAAGPASSPSTLANFPADRGVEEGAQGVSQGGVLRERGAETPTLEIDAPLDPKIANRPLEPGSGVPDLNAILKRVREERGAINDGEAEVARADFIAAARRAAQAAAAEAEMLKNTSGQEEASRRFKVGDIFRARRKTMLLGATAVMVALAGLQLGNAFMNDGSDAPLEIAASSPAEPEAREIPDRPVRPISGLNREDATDPIHTASTEAPVPYQANDGHGDVQMPKAMDGTVPATPADAAAVAPEAAPSISSAPSPTVAANAPAAEPQAPAFTLPSSPLTGPEALRNAAESGDPKALFEIGSRYAEGRGVKTDLKAAAQWYEAAAELGFAPAQYRIGNLYEKGNGVDRDVGKAKTWYQLAAAQGKASAMHNLAVLFAMGADGTPDHESAARWFQQAAELGVKDSQYNLGILAAKGVGMPQNLEESYKWFDLVARQGDSDAAKKRDEVAKALKPDQLERARNTAQLWKAKPLDVGTNAVELPAAWQDGQKVAESTVDMKQVVRNLQRILNRSGYDAGGEDGVMGAKTKSAIAAFQRDNGMEATGRVDEKLVRALIEKASAAKTPS